MNEQENEFSSEIIHQSASAQVSLATQPILRQVEKLCALFSEKNDLDTAGTSGATGFRRNDVPASSSDNR